MSERSAVSPESSPSAPSSSGNKKKRKKKKKPSSSSSAVAASATSSSSLPAGGGVLPSSSSSASPPLVNGVGSSVEDGASPFHDACSGAQLDRDSNVSPVSFHSLDSNDSSLLANPDITFEFNATIPIVDPTTALPPVDADQKLAPAASSTAGVVLGGKKSKKGAAAATTTTEVATVVAPEMAVNSYTCHTPKVVLAAREAGSADVETKNIRRQTSTRVEEADVQFQVSLPTVNGLADDVVTNSTKENSNDSKGEEVVVRTKDPWNRIHRHADPALVSQRSGSSSVEMTAGVSAVAPAAAAGKKGKTKKSVSDSAVKGQQPAEPASPHVNMKETETSCALEASAAILGNAQKLEKEAATDGNASPELENAGTPLSVPSDDPSVTVCLICEGGRCGALHRASGA